MGKKLLSDGVVHALPQDFSVSLTADVTVCEAWEDITPLARNEWICWVEDAKKPETRVKRIAQAVDMLSQGKRRPCCWPGCKHR